MCWLLLTFVIYLTIINLVLLHLDESGFWSNVRTIYELISDCCLILLHPYSLLDECFCERNDEQFSRPVKSHDFGQFT